VRREAVSTRLREEPSFLPNPIEVQTENFYRWEKKGRGWQLWPYPVDIEPPYVPFFQASRAEEPTDDGRRPSDAPKQAAYMCSAAAILFFLLSLSLFNPTLFVLAIGLFVWPAVYFSQKNKEAVSGEVDLPEMPDEEEIDFPAPSMMETNDLCFVQIVAPPETDIGKETSERLLLAMKYNQSPVAFEIVGTEKESLFQLACHKEDKEQLLAQLQAYFPEVHCLEGEDAIGRALKTAFPEEDTEGRGVIVDFGLNNEFMQPVGTVREFRADPLSAFFGVLSRLRSQEVGIFQVLIQPAREDWAESIMWSVTDWEGKPFFLDAPEMTKRAAEKTASPLFAAIVRASGFSKDRDQAFAIVKRLGAGLEQFSLPGSNSFIPLSNEGYDFDDHVEDLILRQSHRSGMLLNSEELVSFAHLPSASVRSEKLTRWSKKSKAAPPIVAGHALNLGENIHGGERKVVGIAPDQRTRHTYVIGASGTGKSTLLLNMIIQDIKNGEGVAVLDPHGDLIDQILGYVPDERLPDVILFDPSDAEYPVGFNILSAHSELEKNLLSSDLVAVFRRLSTSWGDQMTSVLGNAILAFLESKNGGTLSDLRRFLIEPAFRKNFLHSVTDPEVAYYWEKEYPLLAGKPQAPLLTRLDTFLRPKLIRHMVSQKENKVDFRKIMDGGKIFLAKLSQGAVGEENSYLLGTLLVSKLHQIAMSRQEVKESARKNFYLYIDEFQNFITPSMAAILSGARKYHLGLILAHQELRQLWSKDTEVASAVIANPCTRICFRLGEFDAERLEDGFTSFDAKDLQNLGVGEAVCRIERAEYDFNLKTFPLVAVDPDVAEKKRERILALSREKYALRREEVEAALAAGRSQAAQTPVIPEEGHREEVPVEKESVKKEKKEPVISRPYIEQAEEPVRKRTLPEDPAPLGRGGQQHKYIQQLIKKIAEHKGYRATIEKQVLAGAGSIDVALEKEGKKIACEISITTNGKQELGNVEKCLAAGYDSVILVSSEKRNLNKIKEYISGRLENGSLERVLFLHTEEVILYLDELDAQSASKEETVRGYKVKVNYQSVEETQKQTRRQAVAQVIMQAMKRMKAEKI
jgi:hypothetical protein